MSALQAAQWQYENQLPPEVSETPQERAERHWVEEGVGQLMDGADYLFQRRMRPKQGVTQQRFEQAVDEFAMGKLAAPGASQTALGRLILCARSKHGGAAQEAADNLLEVADPDDELRQIAYDLLKPFAAEGVLAQAEEAQ